MLIYFFWGNCWPQNLSIYLPIRWTDHSCWHSGHRLFCLTHNFMQQLWNEWLQSPATRQKKLSFHLNKILNYVRTPNNDTFLLLLVAAVLGLAPQTGVCKCTKVTWQLIVHNETEGLRRSTKIKHLRLGHTCKGRRTLSEVLRLKSCSFSQKVI